jgi:hypothetical protein
MRTAISYALGHAQLLGGGWQKNSAELIHLACRSPIDALAVKSRARASRALRERWLIFLSRPWPPAQHPLARSQVGSAFDPGIRAFFGNSGFSQRTLLQIPKAA